MTRQLLAALRLPRPGVVAMLIPRPLPAFHSSALVIGTLLLAACAPADSGTNTASPPPSDSFDLVDTDHDGTV
jgi:hypothetical protein